MPEPIIQYPPGNDSLFDLPSNITDIILSLKEKKRVKSPVICTKSSKKKRKQETKNTWFPRNSFIKSHDNILNMLIVLQSQQTLSLTIWHPYIRMSFLSNFFIF